MTVVHLQHPFPSMFGIGNEAPARWVHYQIHDKVDFLAFWLALCLCILCRLLPRFRLYEHESSILEMPFHGGNPFHLLA